MGTLLGLALVATSVLGGSAAPRLRVAGVMPKEASDAFKTALKEMGWKADAYADTARDWERLGKDLGDYDVVLASGMQNASAADVPKALRGFMEAGGAIVVTGVTSTNDVAWLAALDPKYAVGVVTPDKAKNPPQTEVGTAGDSSLLSFPARTLVPAEPVAAHFAFAGQNDRGWEKAGTVRGGPCVVVRRFGKGALVLSTARFQDAAFLGNVAKLLELQRMGLAFSGIGHEYWDGSDKIDHLALGSGSTRVSFRNTSGTNISLKVVMTVTGKDASRTFWNFGGQKNPNASFDIGVPVKMDVYGACDVAIAVENEATGKSAALSSFAVTMPDFLEIEPPAYRGMISTTRRDPNVHVAVRLNPVSENVAGTKIEVSVADPAGKALATREVVADGPGLIPLTLPLAADAPAGVYTLAAKALRGGVLPVSATASFKIVPVRPGQMFIDQDSVILNEGKPFFPLGLYHAHAFQDPDAYLALGVNMLQCWNWDWDDNISTNLNVLKIEDAEKRAATIKANAACLAKYKAAGVRLIYEEGSIWGEMVRNSRPIDEPYAFETNAALRAKLEKVRDDPSKLVGMWYIADEVSGKGWVPNLKKAKKLFNDLDEDSLTYNLGTGDSAISPGGDIYAVDVYPRYYGARSPVTRVADIMDSSRRDTGYHQPVIAVLQAFGQKGQPTESPADVRAMSYLAVTHGVQGVFWYCWKQTGDWDGKQSQGMGWYPPTAEMVKAVIAEFKVFAPALMEPGSRMLKSADGRVHAILSGSEKTGRFLVYVNGEYEPCESVLDVPELTKLEPLFGGPDAKISKGKLTLKLPPLATGAFRVTGK